MVAALLLGGCASRGQRPEAPPPRVPTTTASASGSSGQILWFEPAPRDGYAWSFFLYLPRGARPSADAHIPLLVTPNNTGQLSDTPAVDRAAALRQAFSFRLYAERLHAAVLVPTFPRPAARPELYTHALDRDTLLVREGELRRLDLQLIAMIEAAQRALGGAVDERVLLFGFSASGMFANRFTLLHPERVLAAAVGSPGGWPMAPASARAPQPLRYPLGASDLRELTGSPLDLERLRRVQFFFFLGSNDTNDSPPYRDGWDAEDEALATKLLGSTPVARWPVAEGMYRDAGLQG